MGEMTYRITQIESQKKNKDRLNIYLDGGFAFGLAEEVALRHNLHEGDELTESVIDEILLAEESNRAKERALVFLSYRARSVDELNKKLKEKGFSERTICRVIDDFLRVGLLDDRKFALSFTHSRMEQKPMSKRFLQRELIQKGIEEEIVEQAVDEAYGGCTELEIAKDLIQRRIRRYKGDVKAKKKLSDFLLRRGFNWDVISEVLQDILWEVEN